MDTVTLYHGTTEESAQHLLENGWSPNTAPSGANCGQSRHLYLTTEYEDALWFAQQKGSDVVLQLADIPLSVLKVDPEDGFGETVAEEIHNSHELPGKVVLFQPLPAECFKLVEPTRTPGHR